MTENRGHIFDWHDTQILDREKSWNKRIISKMLNLNIIQQHSALKTWLHAASFHLLFFSIVHTTIDFKVSFRSYANPIFSKNLMITATKSILEAISAPL